MTLAYEQLDHASQDRAFLSPMPFNVLHVLDLQIRIVQKLLIVAQLSLRNELAQCAPVLVSLVQHPVAQQVHTCTGEEGAAAPYLKLMGQWHWAQNILQVLKLSTCGAGC